MAGREWSRISLSCKLAPMSRTSSLLFSAIDLSGRCAALYYQQAWSRAVPQETTTQDCNEAGGTAGRAERSATTRVLGLCEEQPAFQGIAPPARMLRCY